SPTCSLMSAANGATPPAPSLPSKLPHCAKNSPIIPIHLSKPIWKLFQPTPSFPVVHRRLVLRRHPHLVNRPNRANRPRNNRPGTRKIDPLRSRHFAIESFLVEGAAPALESGDIFGVLA